jgi:cell division protein FtsL
MKELILSDWTTALLYIVVVLNAIGIVLLKRRNKKLEEKK